MLLAEDAGSRVSAGREQQVSERAAGRAGRARRPPRVDWGELAGPSREEPRGNPCGVQGGSSWSHLQGWGAGSVTGPLGGEGGLREVGLPR